MSAGSSQKTGIPSLRPGTAEWWRTGYEVERKKKNFFFGNAKVTVERPLSAAVHHSASDDCILYCCLGRQTSDAEIRGRDGPA